MTYERLTPTDAQITTLLKSEWDGAIVMVNLLQFRVRAAYPRDYDGPDAEVTGAQAYSRFSDISRTRVEGLGGHILWAGDGYSTMVGPVNERWDRVEAVWFPDCKTYVRMPEDDAYSAALVHRTAGLAETRVIACKSQV